MSIKDRVSRMLRRSNTSAGSDTDRKNSSSTSDKSNKNASSQSTVGRMLSRTFSRRGKSSESSASSASSGIDSHNNTHRSNSTHTHSTATHHHHDTATLDGLRWEDMNDTQRMQARFNAYEIRFGASDPCRASLEGISPCTTRTQHADYP